MFDKVNHLSYNYINAGHDFPTAVSTTYLEVPFLEPLYCGLCLSSARWVEHVWNKSFASPDQSTISTENLVNLTRHILYNLHLGSVGWLRRLCDAFVESSYHEIISIEVQAEEIFLLS